MRSFYERAQALPVFDHAPVGQEFGEIAAHRPGLGRVGPSVNYSEFADGVKVLLSLFMILGRLEFYAVVALFVPGFWRR